MAAIGGAPGLLLGGLRREVSGQFGRLPPSTGGQGIIPKTNAARHQGAHEGRLPKATSSMLITQPMRQPPNAQ